MAISLREREFDGPDPHPGPLPLAGEGWGEGAFRPPVTLADTTARLAARAVAVHCAGLTQLLAPRRMHRR